MAHLKHTIALRGCVQHDLSVRQTGCHRLFTENMFSGPDGGYGQLRMLCVWSCDVNSVAALDDFCGALCGQCAARIGQTLGRFGGDIVDRGEVNAFVTRQNRGVYTANVSSSNDSYFEFRHRLDAGYEVITHAVARGRAMRYLST